MTLDSLKVDKKLMGSLIQGTMEGLALTGIEPEAVGVSRFSTVSRELSVLVGLHGSRNGNLTMNLSEHTAGFLAGRLFGDEEMKDLSEDAIDGVCEIGNMVAGRLKDMLLGSEYAFDAISLPALIFGANYNLYHWKNIVTVCATFEINEVSILRMNDKFFTTSVTLMGK